MASIPAFGPWLKQRRISLDLSRAELANSVGCAVDTLRKLELEKRRPSKQLANRLADCLHLSPAERTVFLQQALRSCHTAEGQVSPAPISNEPSYRTTPRTNIPRSLSAFVGREVERAVLLDLLRQPHVQLVTLSGPPGVGKTRLSVEVATALVPDFPDGVFFVSLAALHDPRLVMPAIAQVLHVAEVGHRPLEVQLQDYLHDRHMLLVLDNFEQLVDAATSVAVLVQIAPRLTVLATSRMPLHIDGEQIYPVSPLPLPDSTSQLTLDLARQSPAINLFTLRTKAVKPDFALNEANMATVAAICARLDGLPLGIELAAARSTLFPPQALLARLDRRLPLLTQGSRNGPVQQQTLRAAIEWSYTLLTDAEQTLFAQLGVFAGSYTLHAVEQVCQAEDCDTQRQAGGNCIGPQAGSAITWNSDSVVDRVAALVDQSLVQQDGTDNESWLRMLETLREYALEQLAARGEMEILRRRHATYYLALAEQAALELNGPQQPVWLERLEREHDNLRTALAWALNNGMGDLAMRLGGALWRFWWIRGHLSEGRHWMEQVLIYSDTADTQVQARALNGLGVLAFTQGDHELAQRCVETSLSLYRTLGDEERIADALIILGIITTYYQRDYQRAQELLDESIRLSRRCRDTAKIVRATASLGFVQMAQRQYVEAQQCFAESLPYYREHGLISYTAVTLLWLGLIAVYQNEYGQAYTCFEESMRLNQQLGHTEGMLDCLQGLAHLVAAARPLCAARLLGAVEKSRERLQISKTGNEVLLSMENIAAAQAQMAPERWAAAWAEGCALTLEQAIAEALDASSTYKNVGAKVHTL